jgi:ABC-type cobalamin/Fe3+-siderophores transport system ATPase subunit
MNKIKTKDYELTNLSKINIVLGKNGCGKSSLLRILDAQSLEVAYSVTTDRPFR